MLRDIFSTICVYLCLLKMCSHEGIYSNLFYWPLIADAFLALFSKNNLRFMPLFLFTKSVELCSIGLLAGLAKILKKYDKRTGALIRLPFIQKVLQEPFFTTDLLNTFVKECEAMLDHLFPSNKSRNLDEEEGEPTTSGTVKTATDESDLLRVPKELSEIEYMESLYMKSTVSALKVLKEIRSGSSTVSVFSLPPLPASGLEDDSWKKKVGVLEQVAK